jgi:membrane associated rhomboid family serine protease
MASERTRQEFDRIVERLTSDYPSLGRPPGLPWSRPVLITIMTVGGVVWALLSMAMVAWGARGVALTGGVAAIAALAAAIDTRRRNR